MKQDYRPPIVLRLLPASRYILVVLISITPVYLIISGRQASIQLLFLVVAFAAIWRFLGVNAILFLLALTVWIPRPTPDLILRFTGPLFAGGTLIEVAVYFLLIVFVANSLVLRGERFELRFPPFWLLLLIYLIGALFAFTNVTRDERIAWQMLRQMSIFPLALTLLVYNTIKTRKQAEWVLFGIMGSAILLGVIKLAGIGYSAEQTSNSLAERLSGAYHLGPLGTISVGLNTGALFFGLAAALAWSLCLNARNPLLRFSGVLAFLLLGAIIIQMGTRSVWFGLFAACVLIAWLSLRRSPGAFWRIMALMTLAFAGLFVLASTGLLNEEIKRRAATITNYSKLVADPTWTVRLHIWNEALQMLWNSPFGTGYVNVLSVGFSTHNDYITWAMVGGIEGLLAIFAFLVLWLRRMFISISNISQTPDDWLFPGMIGSVVVYMVSILAADPSKRFWVYAVFWFIISIGGVAANLPKEEKQFP
jgi:O-antigen ligase